MFCGWGHRRGCVCEVCYSLTLKSPRFSNRRKTIMKVAANEKELDEMLKRPRPGERVGPIEDPFNDADFKARYPCLADHLTSSQYDDRSPRQTSTILVFCDNGVLRICVNDRDNNRSVFFTSETVEGAFLAAENAISTNTADWKTRTGYGSNTPKTPF